MTETTCPDCDADLSAVVLPIVATEVRKAKAEALTDLAESSIRTAQLAASRGDTEWEEDARFVARESREHRDALYPEECE